MIGITIIETTAPAMNVEPTKSCRVLGELEVEEREEAEVLGKPAVGSQDARHEEEKPPEREGDAGDGRQQVDHRDERAAQPRRRVLRDVQRRRQAGGTAMASAMTAMATLSGSSAATPNLVRAVEQRRWW